MFATHTSNLRRLAAPATRMRASKARLVAVLATLCVALGAASGAEAAAITLQTTGSPGPWYALSGFDLYCQGTYWYTNNAPYDRWVVLQRQQVGRSPSYAYRFSRQDIYMYTQLLWSTDGSNWNVYLTRSQKVSSVSPGFSAEFEQEAFDVTPYPNILWRVKTQFSWYLTGTSTLLGTAVDGYRSIQTNYNVNTFGLNNGEKGCTFP